MLCILLFLSGCCLKTEVIKQLYYREYAMKPVFLFLPALAMAALCGCGGKSRAAEGPQPDLFTGELSGEITVSAYDAMTYRSFLEDAARSFQALHPGATITVETFSAMPEIRRSGDGDKQMVLVQSRDDPQGRADYVSRVNAGLMSGKGADLYAMDVLPLHKFVEAGQLENLEAYMNGDPGFNKTDYRENILEALRLRGGIWFLPTNYGFNYFGYDSALVPKTAASKFGTGTSWNSGELLAMGEQYYGGGADGSAKIFNLPDYSPTGGFARQVLYENIHAYVDLENKKADFVNGGFAGLLESVRRAGEAGYVPQGVAGQESPEGRRLLLRAEAEETGRAFFKLRNNFSLASHFSQGTGISIMTEGGGELGDSAEGIAGIAADADGRVPFECGQGYGISSGSRNKALAWAFVKFLLTEEMQLSTGITTVSALPLNNKARAQKAEQIFSGAFMGREAPMSAGQKEALEKYIAATEELSDKINYFRVLDSAVNDMITAEMRYFFNGSKTAEEVAAVLQNQVDLRLNE
jgi:multiple sugar transport system substrate-binding protein